MSLVKLIRLSHMKQTGERIIALRCYDATLATIASLAGSDILMVDEGLTLFSQGNRWLNKVSLEDISYHTRCVSKGNSGNVIVSTLPGMRSLDSEKTLSHCRKLLQAGADVIRITGNENICPQIRKITAEGIPVCVHLNYSNVFEINKCNINTLDAEKNIAKIIGSILKIEHAGAAMIHMESVPSVIVEKIKLKTSIPLICDDEGMAADGYLLDLYNELILGEKNQEAGCAEFKSFKDLLTFKIKKARLTLRQET